MTPHNSPPSRHEKCGMECSSGMPSWFPPSHAARGRRSQGHYPHRTPSQLGVLWLSAVISNLRLRAHLHVIWRSLRETAVWQPQGLGHGYHSLAAETTIPANLAQPQSDTSHHLPLPLPLALPLPLPAAMAFAALITILARFCCSSMVSASSRSWIRSFFSAESAQPGVLAAIRL